MNKNEIIKKNLETYLHRSIKSLQQHSLSERLKSALENTDEIIWWPSPDFTEEALKKQYKADIIALLNNNQFHDAVNRLLENLVNITDKSVQENTANHLINNLSSIAEDLPTQKKQLSLNLLFIEHDYYPEACFCGFDDPTYSFKVLSGQEYLEYEYDKELFNGAGKFDYAVLWQPLLKFKEEFGEDMIYVIEETAGASEYLADIEEMYRINAYLGIHNCLNDIGNKLRDINIPMKEEVFVFGNEHDSEQFSIYVL